MKLDVSSLFAVPVLAPSELAKISAPALTYYVVVNCEPNDSALYLMKNEDGVWVWTGDEAEAAKFAGATAAADAIKDFEASRHPGRARWYNRAFTKIVERPHA